MRKRLGGVKMKDKTFLMIPGPTPVPESVLLALAKHPIGHRSGEFSKVVRDIEENLKWLFQTKNDVFVYTSSGTGAMDGALSNLINEGDKVLSLVLGNFGKRWVKIAKSRGAEVETLEVEAGKIITPEMLKEKLKDLKDIKLVTLTHSETSTGAANPVKDLIPIIKEYGALSVVDGVTSVAAMNCPMDAWGIDVLVSGSQKGFMIPPGLAFIAVSDKAMEMHKQCKYPSFYFDWTQHKKSLDADTTPWTPAVNLFIALDVALKMMREDGLDKIYAQHKRNALALRNGVRAIGLKLFVPEDENASYSITSIYPPEGISVPDIRSTLKNEYDIVVANGQNDLKDKIFRMGTLGFVSDRDVLTAISSLEAALLKLGYKFETGAGLKAVLKTLEEVK